MGPGLLCNETQLNGIIWPDRCNGNQDFSKWIWRFLPLDSPADLNTACRFWLKMRRLLGKTSPKTNVGYNQKRQASVTVEYPALSDDAVWDRDRNNWHGSLWRPTYVSWRGEVRHSYKNKSLKWRHKRKVKKLEGETRHGVDEKKRVRQWRCA